MLNIAKNKIIVEVLNHLDNPKETEKLKEDRRQFSKKYHITIKRVSKKNTKQMLINFILNKEGYNITINDLFNSI